MNRPTVPPPDPTVKRSPTPTAAAHAQALSTLPDTLRRLAERGVVRRYRKQQVIIEEGSVGDTLHLILSGQVKACSIDHRRREIIYGVYGPGDYVGEMSLDGGPRSANVIALEPTAAVVLTRMALQAHIADEPAFAFELLSRVIRRARMATATARNMALLDVYGRLVHLLDSLAQPCSDGSRLVADRLTHADIAARVGCSREMVSRLMKDLETGGYVSRDGRALRIHRELPARW